MNQYRLIIKLFVFLFIGMQLSAQEDESLINFDRLYSGEFRMSNVGRIKWFKDGSFYTILESSVMGENIVKYTPGIEGSKIFVAAEDLIPEERREPLEIDGYSISEDKNKVLIYTNSKKVWRRNTRGDYWIFDRTSRKLNQIGVGLKESCLMFAKIAPDGQKAAYVYENNIYVEDLNSNKRKQLTFDGTETIINGTFDWVYEEEFFCTDGFRWSPDSKNIAYWQLDASKIKVFYLINNTDSLYPFTIPIKYPKAGQDISSARVGVVSITGGEPVWMKIKGDPANNYIPYMEWTLSNNEIMIQQLNRHQNTNHVFLGNIQNGEVNEILTETDVAWLEYVEDIYWIENGKYFIWESERSGWNHLYMVSRDGKEIKSITKGDYDVINLEMVDEKKDIIYFIASPENPTQRYLYRTKFKGYTEPKVVTPSIQKGSSRYSISPNGKYAIHTFSSFGTPYKSAVISLPAHNELRILKDNNKLKDKLSNLKKMPVEFFKIEIDEGIMDGYMMKPYDFDETKKYPVLFLVYGEPWGQMVRDGWSGRYYLWSLLLTQKGYIVISFDTRGTSCPKGRDYRKACYLKLGEQNSYEHAKVTREIIKWPFVDANRIAIYGKSGGGTSTLNAMFRYPDLYKTGMAAAPVPDLTLYDAIYQERYMRTPQEVPDKYKNLSAVTHAKNLKGNLLIVHGTGDDNVHYQGTERLINELIKHNRPFDMMSYPNRSHSISEGKNTSRHFYELLTRYLTEHVEPGGK